jgi:hypothetical protein
MVSKIPWLENEILINRDPIRLVRMVNEIVWLTVLAAISQRIFFTHVASTWGSSLVACRY